MKENRVRIEPNNYYTDYGYLCGIGAIPEWSYDWTEDGILYLHPDIEMACQYAWQFARETGFMVNPVDAYLDLWKKVKELIYDRNGIE